ncbi:hypothetical protein M441DRAFT_136423, partial [Trichoderma asperellum CBS 433.97]
FFPLVHLVCLRDDETNTYECHGSNCFFRKEKTCPVAILVKGHPYKESCSMSLKYV